MIIKYYALDGTMYIIDAVSDVRVVNDEDMLGLCVIENYDGHMFGEPDEKQIGERMPKPKFIAYTKEMSYALKVNNVAYICNDDGKTIEKVSV